MSKGSEPASPDYTAAAEEQGQQTQQLNAQQTANNRPDVTTPWGSLTYSQGTPYIDPATGTLVDNPQENVSLTPEEQQSVDAQQAISANRTGTAQSLLTGLDQQVNQPNPTVPAAQSLTGAGQGIDYNPSSLDAQTENAVWNQFENMQEPLQQQQTQQQNAQLAAQGLKPGDAAYDTANTNLLNTQFSQDQTAEDQAVLAGQQEASTLFGEQNSAQAQGYGQDASQLEYDNSLIPQNISNEEAGLGLGQEQDLFDANLMTGLLNGQQVSMPSFPGTTSAGSGQAANLLQAAEDQGNADLNEYNAQVGQSNSTDAALASLLGSVAIAAS